MGLTEQVLSLLLKYGTVVLQLISAGMFVIIGRSFEAKSHWDMLPGDGVYGYTPMLLKGHAFQISCKTHTGKAQHWLQSVSPRVREKRGHMIDEHIYFKSDFWTHEQWKRMEKPTVNK